MFGFTRVSYVFKSHFLVRQLLLTLFHLAISIYSFVLRLASKLECFMISSGLLRRYKDLDLSQLQCLAIVVDSEEAKNTLKIVKLLRWVSAIGVKRVILYDKKGLLKESKDVIIEKLSNAKPWEMEVDGRVLVTDQRQMTVETVSFANGKQGVAKAANFLCSKYMKVATLGGDHRGRVFTEANMTSALASVGYGGPEPNLLLIYGPARCHQGFPAWRLTYTEIVYMGRLKHMQHGALVKAIHKFIRVEQNYGKYLTPPEPPYSLRQESWK